MCKYSCFTVLSAEHLESPVILKALCGSGLIGPRGKTLLGLVGEKDRGKKRDREGRERKRDREGREIDR